VQQKTWQDAGEAFNKERIRQQRERLNRHIEHPGRSSQPYVRPLSEAGIAGHPLDEPPGMEKALPRPPSERSIYYGYNAHSIESEYYSMLQAHAQFLRRHRDLKLRVEGNCDERGSTEYNLALGQRRADLVKRALVLLGVPENRISAVSFGAQRPKVIGYGDLVWAHNRRSDLIYINLDRGI
jgi:peptidoglycan-associated lipoprotein